MTSLRRALSLSIISKIKRFSNTCLTCHIHEVIQHLFLRASFCALKQMQEGIRPLLLATPIDSSLLTLQEDYSPRKQPPSRNPVSLGLAFLQIVNLHHVHIQQISPTRSLDFKDALSYVRKNPVYQILYNPLFCIHSSTVQVERFCIQDTMT